MFLSVVLFSNAIFNLVAWPSFLRRVMRDPRARDATGAATPFLRVHALLVGIAVVLAVLSAIGGILVLTA